ncbi:hypothetical protein [Streptomyces sp. NPDC017941]|uniref:hypothetical protein n=1 Tax=unclassified Streptomyces TaxID=2593676 RepID=UPI00378C059B
MSSATPVDAPAQPPLAVEDFGYPNADKIFAEQGIRLKSGDGHITLATCDGEPGLLEVWARGPRDRYCFKVSGNRGYLRLDLPGVFGVKGNSYDTDVNMTVAGTTKSFDIEKNTWTPVGETSDDQGRQHTLVEIISVK